MTCDRLHCYYMCYVMMWDLGADVSCVDGVFDKAWYGVFISQMIPGSFCGCCLRRECLDSPELHIWEALWHWPHSLRWYIQANRVITSASHPGQYDSKMTSACLPSGQAGVAWSPTAQCCPRFQSWYNMIWQPWELSPPTAMKYSALQ